MSSDLTGDETPQGERGSFYVTDSIKRDTENGVHFTPLLLQVSC